VTERVIVVGGGVVGLCSAYFLRRAGADVVVLERDRVGSGASRGNAGEICPGEVEPLPAPGLVRHAIGNLFRRDAALFVEPRFAPFMAGFLVRLARHCTRTAYERGLSAMAELGRRTFELYDELAREGIAVGMGTDGYLICCSSVEEATAEREAMVRLAEHGLARTPEPVLGAAEVADLEPSLSEYARAGFVQPGERWIDPSGFVDRLAGSLRGMGVEVVEGARVTRVREERGRVLVESGRGRFEGETAVVAAGAWSRELCRALGVRLSMQPGKGYSFSVRPRPMPRRVLNFPGAHVIVTPMGERLRVAGTMEFDGTYDRFDRRRIEAIVRGVSPYFRGVEWAERSEEWVGPRPMTPDGLPYIGPLPGRSRVFVAAGHNMLGVTLAPATGKVVAGLVLSGDPGIDLAPFSPSRFARR